MAEGSFRTRSLTGEGSQQQVRGSSGKRLTKSRERMSYCVRLQATPVEGDFGGDFVRRNRSQLNCKRHGLYKSVSIEKRREIWLDEMEHYCRIVGSRR